MAGSYEWMMGTPQAAHEGSQSKSPEKSDYQKDEDEWDKTHPYQDPEKYGGIPENWRHIQQNSKTKKLEFN